jgi:uncharacterized protein (DUF362 family)
MIHTVNVAVVRGDRRRETVSQALALVAGEIAKVIQPHVLVKPNLVSHKAQLPSTHAATLRAAIEAVIAAGGRSVTIAEGASNASAAFERFGYHRQVKDLRVPVRFFDINREENEWEPLTLTSVHGQPRVARVSRTIVGSSFRVSLALAKTHVTSIVTLGLKNMLSSFHPDDRVMMHGHLGGGNGYTGWKRLAVEFLKGDNLAVSVLTRTMGRVKNARNAWKEFRRAGEDPYTSLSQSELGYLRSVEAMNRNLVSLARATRPHLTVVDGFVGMHREGPRHGTPIRLGTVIAGIDPVAVDTVAAAVMGFDPSEIGYLVYAHEAGLGIGDLERITILGDPIATVRRKFVPHSNHVIQRHWRRISEPSRTVPAPHLSLAKAHAGRTHTP